MRGMRQRAATSHGSRGRAAGVVVRSAVATVEIVGFSAYAHAHADGRLPTPDELLWVAAGVFAATALLLTGRARMPVVLGACAALQVGLHVTYASLAPASAPSMHSMHGMPGMHATATGAAMGAMPTGQMVLAHVVSAVVTALVLIVQEQAVRRLAAVRALRGYVLPARTRPCASTGVATPATTLELIRVSPTRGPPGAPSPSTS